MTSRSLNVVGALVLTGSGFFGLSATALGASPLRPSASSRGVQRTEALEINDFSNTNASFEDLGNSCPADESPSPGIQGQVTHVYTSTGTFNPVLKVPVAGQGDTEGLGSNPFRDVLCSSYIM